MQDTKFLSSYFLKQIKLNCFKLSWSGNIFSIVCNVFLIKAFSVNVFSHALYYLCLKS
jgi:hypothetical protein